MHELSLASSVLEIALRHAGGRRVSLVEVEIGALRQVAPDSMAFSFDLLAQGTPAEGALLKIDPIAASGRCRACGATTVLSAFPLQCGVCGGFELEIVAGNELMVAYLELEDEEDGGTGDKDRDGVGDGGDSRR